MTIVINLSGQPTPYDVWFSQYGIWVIFCLKCPKKAQKRDFPRELPERLFFGNYLDPKEHPKEEIALIHLTSRLG